MRRGKATFLSCLCGSELSNRKNNQRRSFLSCLCGSEQFINTRVLSVDPPCSFNPRAHVGRDDEIKDFDCEMQVSIHAPTWGATYKWGCCSLSKGFQSTRPRGARPERVKFVPEIAVSIHAPTWGATF